MVTMGEIFLSTTDIRHFQRDGSKDILLNDNNILYYGLTMTEAVCVSALLSALCRVLVRGRLAREVPETFYITEKGFGCQNILALVK